MTARAARVLQLRHQCAAAGVIVALAAAGCAAASPARQQDSGAAKVRGPVPVGECVVLHGDGRADPLSAAAVDCDAAMSYTVSAHTDVTGECPPPGDGSVFVEPFGDRLTARLCLVPNLAVGHCYAFGTPLSRYEPIDCVTTDVATIRIEQRFEVSDADACNDPSRATVYQAVPRTYCVSYPGLDA
ncbi:MAG: hypothetical protein ACSLE6_10010 [Mycobacterium sp.]